MEEVKPFRTALLIIGQSLAPQTRPLNGFLHASSTLSAFQANVAAPLLAEGTLHLFLCGHFSDPGQKWNQSRFWRTLGGTFEYVTRPPLAGAPGLDFNEQFERMAGCFAAASRRERVGGVSFTHFIRAGPHLLFTEPIMRDVLSACN